MALKNYKVDEAIEVVYQAAGAKTGIVVTMNVYDEAGELDVAQSGEMAEVGVTGRYKLAFTPDANGNWSVQIADAGGGKSVAAYSVGNYNVDSVGSTAASIDAKVDTTIADVGTLDGKVVTLDGKVLTVDGKVVAVGGVVDIIASDVATLDGKVVTLDGKVDALDSKIDAIQVDVDSISAPPMIG